MNMKLLKEYIRLIVENVILELGTIGTTSTTSLRSSMSTVSSTRSTGTKASESTLGTGSSADKQSDTEDSISNIEDAVKSNSETIANNQKAVNTAANKMAVQTNNMISSTAKTADGLSSASAATKNLTKPEQSRDDVVNNIDRQSKGFDNAASGVKATENELQKTLTTLQGLQGATETK